MSWNLTVSGDLIKDAEKTAEDLERELFDAVGPVLKRFGAYASHFMGQHITGAPHQVTSDAAAPAGTTGGSTAVQADVSADTSGDGDVPVTTAADPAGEDQAAFGGIESDPDPLNVPVPSTAAEPDPASDPAQDTGAAATT